jgi:hypothetical protein
MNTPLTKENIVLYTDMRVHISQKNGNGMYVGIGRISLEKNEAQTLRIEFESIVQLDTRLRKADDAKDDDMSFPVLKTYQKNHVKKLASVSIVKSTGRELRLQSNEGTTKVYVAPALQCLMIDNYLSRCR